MHAHATCIFGNIIRLFSVINAFNLVLHYFLCIVGEMDRLRKFWLTGACKKSATGKGRQSSDPLDIVNFTSAYILLIVGVALAIILLLVEHIYFTFCRRRLRKIDRCGCCALISLVRLL